MSRRALLAGGGVTVAAAAAGGWFFFLREGDGDDASGGGDDGSIQAGSSPDSPGTGFDSAPAVSSGRHGPYQIDTNEDHVFAVELDSGDQLEVTMEFEHQEGDLDIDLYDSTRTLRDSSTSVSDNETVSLTAAESGTYYINPYGFGGATNSYELVVEINDTGGGDDGTSDPPGGSSGPGSSIQNAPMVSSGVYGPYQISGGEDHYFAVELEEGDTLGVTMEFTHADGDLDLDVLGPGESVRASAASISDDETVSLTANDSGTYYINPYGFGGASNTYELIVEIN